MNLETKSESDCIFCKIIGGEVPCYKIWENEKFFLFLDRMPINPCHMLLIPKKHEVEVFDLDDELYSEIFSLVKKISKPLKEVTKAKRIGLAVEGLGIFHSHVHIVPIYNSNELNPERAKMASEEELEKSHKMLAEKIMI